MCTAVSWKSSHHYFGRNLDLNGSYLETITITPRAYPLTFLMAEALANHYAMIGTAVIWNEYPLYYDATNEKGLSMAGLNFPKSAHYNTPQTGSANIAPFEFIPWILAQCSSVSQAKQLLEKVSIVDIPFSDRIPLTPLHWIIADAQEAITVEATIEGLKIYENNIGILTNEPPFPYHIHHLQNYMQVSPRPVQNFFSKDYTLTAFSAGMGSLGLPGDYSSASRFVRAAFVKCNSVSDGSQEGDIHQFFHILSAVAMPRGCVELSDNDFEITQYSSCCDTDLGIYYYHTYHNRQINAVDIRKENLDAEALISYPMITAAAIHLQN